MQRHNSQQAGAEQINKDVKPEIDSHEFIG